jgi:uncharacterized protein YbjT (DUF2867 family)
MILVTGGTGFVGSHLVARLLEAGEQVRVLARSPVEVPGAEVHRGDARDLAAVLPAVRGCRAVIHLIGIIREAKGASFEAVHVETTRALLRACQESGVRRFLHMSALGSRPRARSRYHRTKWEAEETVRASGLAATIFRPSVIFGSGSSFLPQMRDLVHRAPVIPIIGDGMSLLQPVWVQDVVSCFVSALADDDTAARAYDLGGPETYGFEQLLDLLAEHDQVRTRKIHLPVWLVRPAVAVLSRLLPNFPLTSDQLTMLLEDNTCEIAEMQRTFRLEPASLRDHLAE